MTPIGIEDGIHRAATCLLSRGGAPWGFADAERASIDRHWTRRVAETPTFFNGRVHIMVAGALAGGRLTGVLAETDFASSLYWRETGYRDRSVADCFGSALLVGADNVLIYGLQSSGNVNAGLAYPPGGFLDRSDVGADGRVDLDGSIGRELFEETGLHATSLEREPGYIVTRDGPLVSVGIVYRSRSSSGAIIDQVAAFLGQQRRPELAAVVALADRSAVDAFAMPAYAKRLCEWWFADGARRLDDGGARGAS